ncbi:hypothetical protein [Gilvimarinus xylanilyticus]|uniref:Tyr recombinase domain-containing protein n=1 Tax=Gilvimarinus xylanilyticus TaxID=2944139 RepID=A0A9X2I7M8_9GAMM|nr:hypothetical protein [Gilvimarinus xylanilyticus]MCP8900937.1 hypothetical protein [Gilvimarinus xylanilyticus]
MSEDKSWVSPKEAASQLAAGLKSELASVNRRDLVKYHNAYTEYVVSLLMFASGHRPVDDVFCYRAQLDEKAGLVIIDDKATNEARRYRVAYLPDVACEQLRYYLDHLAQVVNYLRPRRNKELRTALESSLSGSFASALPFFFYLTKDGVAGVGYEALSRISSRYSHAPPNINRKWLATELVSRNAPAWLVASCMGHMETAVLPNGRFCRESQLEIRAAVSERLNPALLSAGWTAVTSKFRPQYGWDDGLPDFIDVGRELGPELRFKWRDSKRREAKSIIRETVSSLEREGQSFYSSEAKMQNLRDQLIETLKAKSVPLKYAFELFARYLAKRSRDNPQITNLIWSRSERLEPSVWGRRDLQRYQVAASHRQKLFELLEERAKQRKDLSYEESLAFRIFTLAFMSGLSTVNVFEAAQANQCTLIQVKNNFLLKISTERSEDLNAIPIDAYSAALSRMLLSSAHSNGTSGRLELLRVARHLGLAHQNLKQLFASLSRDVLAISRLESSGPIHAVAVGLLKQTAIDLKVLTRLLYRKPLDSSFELEANVVSGPEIQLSSRECTDPIKSISSFIVTLREAMSRDSIDGYIRDNKNSERIVGSSLSLKEERAYLSRHIKKYLKQYSLPALGQLIGYWGAWLCENKTRYKNAIQAKTIVEYVSLIAKSLRSSAGDLVLQYDQDEWAQAYLGAIEGSTIGGMSSLASRLYDFHVYLMENWNAPEIVWDDIFATAGSKNIASRVDVNIVTFDEYQSAVEFLVKHHANNYEFRFSAWLLFLGFRFGLRWSEAYYLTERDLIVDTSAGLYVRVCENSRRRLKTPSATRIIPLIGSLSGVEKSLVDSMLSTVESTGESGEAGSRLLCMDPARNVLIDEFRIGKIVNSVLKQASGDSRLRFHHLRHGYASRLMVLTESGESTADSIARALLEPLDPADLAGISKNQSLQGVLSLRAISDLLGHADMATTLHSYVHVFDLGKDRTSFPLEPAPSDRLMALVLGRSESAVRKKRQRSQVEREASAVQRWMMLELGEDGTPVYPVQGARSFQIVVPDTRVQQSILFGVRHRILVRYSMYREEFSLLARRTGVDTDVVRAVIKAGVKMERVSGYERFSLNSGLALASDGEFRNMTEWQNIDKALNKINSIDGGVVERAVLSWAGSYHTSSTSYFFYDFEDLICFLRCLMALDMVIERASFRVIGRVDRDSQTIEHLKGLGVIEESVRPRYHRLGKGTKTRKRSICLNLKRVGGSLSTKKQINRLFFVISSSMN